MTARRPAATVGEVLRATARRFARARLHFGHGTANARDEAAWLIGHVLRIRAGEVGMHLTKPVSPPEERRVRAFASRRVRERIPLAYLLREAWLGELAFYVDRRAIIPRSYIAELLHERLRPWLRRPVRRALDLCTGSGCLAVLLADAFPGARVDASDGFAGPLEVARINVARYRLGARIRLLRSDLYVGLGDARYDLIVCNPPYVTPSSMRALPREYRHEPARALAGGRHGLDVVRRVLAGARAHLSPRGLLVCEIGGNRRALERVYPGLPFAWPETSAGAGAVFVLEREDLTTGSAPPSGTRARRAAR